MKTGIFMILCVALVASCISIRADDTANQAAARAALEQKFYELDHPAAQPPPNTNSVAVPAAQPAKAAPASTAPAGAAFAQKIPAAYTSAQAAALAALEQKMYELNHPAAQPRPDTNSVAAPVATTPVAARANEASAAAAPVTETPTAQVPVAMTPAMIPAAVAPVSTAPAAAASVAAVPAAAAGPVAAPTRTPLAVAPVMPQPGLGRHAAILPSSSSGPVRPANELVTTTGVIYKNVEVERVVADGIVISYSPANGAWAMTKVYFRDLPTEIRQQYEK